MLLSLALEMFVEYMWITYGACVCVSKWVYFFRNSVLLFYFVMGSMKRIQDQRCMHIKSRVTFIHHIKNLEQ